MLVSVFLIALVVFYPVNPNQYIVTVADDYIGVKSGNTGEQLPGFKQTLQTGIKVIVPHEGLLVCVKSVVYRPEPTTQAIRGEPANGIVSVIVDPTFVTADAFVFTYDEPRNTEHTHDEQATQIDLRAPLWQREEPMNARFC